MQALYAHRLIPGRAPPGGSWCGFGQRMLATDRAEYALLDTRQIALDTRSGEVATDDA